MEKIIQKIQDFEMLNNGVDPAFIDIFDVQITPEEVVCTVVIYDDDLSSKSVYTEVAYPRKLLKDI